MIKWLGFAADRKRRMICIRCSALAVAAALTVSLFRLLPVAARTYTITDGERVMTYTTFATDPAQVLGEAGLSLGEQDSYTAGGGSIQVQRMQRIRLSLYGQERLVTSAGETVGELLRREGICPGEGDILSHSLDTQTWDGLHLRLDTQLSRQETYTAAISHDVLECYDASLPAGERRVLVGGVDGELLRTAEVTYTNQKETQRKVLSEMVTLAPVTEVVAVGTGEAPAQEEAGLQIGDGYIRLPTGEVLTYYDTAQVRATAYTHTDAGCDFITYTGTRVRIGTVAVDPRFIPYGTRMFIVSNDGAYIYGISVAEDCGGAIKRDRVDLYFPTYEACMDFGWRRCTIYFLG